MSSEHANVGGCRRRHSERRRWPEAGFRIIRQRDHEPGGIRDVRHRIVVAFGALSLGSAVLHLTPAQAYQLDTVNLVGCAQDGGVCRMPYPTNVYYGVPGRTNGRPFPQGGMVPCNTQTFGDPAPGQAKSCWYAPRITAGGGTDRRRIDEDDEPRRAGP
jgi:hypothetical protein